MTKQRRFNNVSELARHLSDAQATGSDSIASDLEQRLASRHVIKELLAIRAAKSLSQSDIAQKLSCTQSRVSKLESGSDDDLRLGDLRDYLRAMGLDLTLVVGDGERRLVEQIKYHWSCLGQLLRQLVEVASTDATIATGVGKFATEFAFNFGLLTLNFLNKLPDDAKCELPPILIINDNSPRSNDQPPTGAQAASREPLATT